MDLHTDTTFTLLRIAQLQELAATYTAGPQPPAAPAATSFASQLARAAAPAAGTPVPAGPAAPAAAPGGPPVAAPAGTIGPPPEAPATAPAASAGAPASGGGSPYDAEIKAAAAKHDVDPAMLRGLIKQESNFDPKAGSPAGAQGLTQLMPGTARALGVADPSDPAQAIEGGARYLREQLDRFGGDAAKALAAYNAGPGAVERHGGVPPYAETREYVRRVLEFTEQYRRGDVRTGSSAPAA